MKVDAESGNWIRRRREVATEGGEIAGGLMVPRRGYGGGSGRGVGGTSVA